MNSLTNAEYIHVISAPSRLVFNRTRRRRIQSAMYLKNCFLRFKIISNYSNIISIHHFWLPQQSLPTFSIYKPSERPAKLQSAVSRVVTLFGEKKKEKKTGVPS